MLLTYLVILTAGTLAFLSNKVNYTVISFTMALSLYVSGIIEVQEVYAGFSNIAVITLAIIMLISSCIVKYQDLSFFVHNLCKINSNLLLLLTCMLLCAFLSAFINNLGALSIMLPIVYQVCQKKQIPVSKVLLPLSYASVLGGMCTTIGTPPNILVNDYKLAVTGSDFHLFELSYIGVPIALVTILIITVLAFIILPKNSVNKMADGEHIIEAKVNQQSNLIGQEYIKFAKVYTVVAVLRNGRYLKAKLPNDIQSQDIVFIRVNLAQLQALLKSEDFTFNGLKNSSNLSLYEVIVPKDSRLSYKTSISMALKQRFGITILGVSSLADNNRINQQTILPGSIVLIAGNNILDSISRLALIVLNKNVITTSSSWFNVFPGLLLLFSLLAASMLKTSLPIMLSLAVLILLITKHISIKSMAKMINFEVLSLVAFLLPLGKGMTNVGLDKYISQFILSYSINPWILLLCLLVITMMLSDLLNNSATAVLMLPIGEKLAALTQTNLDPWLIAIAVASSCAFLTPISHQNNTIVMKPGKYQFIDYIKLGMPIELIILGLCMPLIPFIWPFF